MSHKVRNVKSNFNVRSIVWISGLSHKESLKMPGCTEDVKDVIIIGKNLPELIPYSSKPETFLHILNFCFIFPSFEK